MYKFHLHWQIICIKISNRCYLLMYICVSCLFSKLNFFYPVTWNTQIRYLMSEKGTVTRLTCSDWFSRPSSCSAACVSSSFRLISLFFSRSFSSSPSLAKHLSNRARLSSLLFSSLASNSVEIQVNIKASFSSEIFFLQISKFCFTHQVFLLVTHLPPYPVHSYVLRLCSYPAAVWLDSRSMLSSGVHNEPHPPPSAFAALL